MKTSPYYPFLRSHRAGNHATLLAIPALLLWLTLPLRAEVIDDFSNGKKFHLYARDEVPQWEIVDGQLHFGLPTPGAYGAFSYLQSYELPEGKPVEFRLDVVSLNASDVAAGLLVGFSGPADVPRGNGRGYTLYYLKGRVALVKTSEVGEYSFFDTSGSYYASDPVTLSLTLTRQGDSLKLGAKVFRRDDPSIVIFPERVVTDTTAIQGTGDNGAPHAGPVIGVGVNCLTLPGGATKPQAVFDNLVCSEEPTPRLLEIQRPAGAAARLEWRSGSILLEASDLAGPWRPCPEVAFPEAGALAASIPLSESARFFRLAPGSQVVDNFATPWDFTSWKTTPTAGGQGRRPAFGMANGHGRLRGLGDGNQDFVMYWGFCPAPAHESFASVDIVDWDETMADAALGLLLRVKSVKDLWMGAIEGLPHDRYAGLLTFKKASSPTESVLSITGPGDEVLAMQRVPAVNPNHQYRLRFWAVGDQLTLELFDLTEPQISYPPIAAKDGRVPAGVDALCGTKSANGTYDVSIDRFVLSCATW